MIEAITFDFWDTIGIDDSDEPKRRALGLLSKTDARIQLFTDKICVQYPEISQEQAALAYQYANERFREEWHGSHRTPGVTSRIYYAYEYLGLQPEPGQYAKMVREADTLVRDIEAMEIRIPPDFATGIHETLSILSQEYKLGIISDTIHTTGRGLRSLLERGGLLQYFDTFIFSDEIGASKPATQVFKHAIQGLGVAPVNIVHIGDRESNDIVGPRSVGMKAILYTGIIDRGEGKTRANATCRDYRDLPRLVSSL